jgi:hypothetical protein
MIQLIYHIAQKLKIAGECEVLTLELIHPPE